MLRKEFFLCLRNNLPELTIASAALLFFLRELGTFPAAWNDDSLFMIVAREYSLGNGYVLPLLGRPWPNPYILAVGSPLIYPAAFFMKMLGPSVVAARIPMVIYLCGTAILLYWLTRKIADRHSARFATALLVSLSAFVNTGKVVMGEVPGIFFSLIALLLLTKKRMSVRQSILCGICVGLSIVTKLPYAFVLAGVGVAWMWALLQKRYPEVRSLTIAGFCALLAFVVFSPQLGIADKGFFVEIYAWLMGTDDILLPKHVLWTQPESLLRLPFFSYGLIFALGTVGFLKLRRSIPNALSISIVTTIILFTAYTFSRSGWYRHLLAAHILLLPFVPTGTRIMLGKNRSILALSAMVLIQAWWQWDHRGSSRSRAAEEMSVYIQKHFADTNVIVQSAPVFMHLPKNPRWIFLTNPTLSTRIPPALLEINATQRCFTLIREFNHELNKEEIQEFGGRARNIVDRYFIIAPPATC